MNWVDWVLLVAALTFAVSGYRRGFVVGVLAFAGFVAGGVLGLVWAPRLVESLQPGPGQSLLAVAVVLVAASVGQVLLGWLGAMVRARITWPPARLVDSGLGALVSVVALLLVAWFLATSLRPGPLPSLSRQIGASAVITEVDKRVPEQAQTLFSSFRQVLDDNGLPTVFGGLSPERIRPVPPPAETVTASRQVRRAAASVVEVEGSAPDCDRRLDGSGFVVSDQHVLTNAHVVAGVENPQVQVGGGGVRYDAVVVLFDPDRDLAVLHVPALPAAALDLDPDGGRGDSAVVAGFPDGGPYRLVPARIRDTVNARGTDIYHERQVTREVFSLFADVRPGNSGGPLLSPRGDVYGVVFAKSLDDPQTGYALTADEAATAVAAAGTATAAVSTGTCA